MEITCECDADTGIPCEDHMKVWSVRQGASLRTGHELVSIFIIDAMEILVEKNIKFPDVPDSIIQLEGWLEDEGDIYYLEEVKEYFERHLGQLGIYVEWEDGFIIYYIPNGPLSD